MSQSFATLRVWAKRQRRPAKPDNAEMPKLKTPEARRPATNSQDNINTVMPSPEGISDRAGDDTKQ